MWKFELVKLLLEEGLDRLEIEE